MTTTHNDTRGALQTEFEFSLPSGYVDDDGTIHTEGTMRLATAADEINPLRDPRVKANQAYMTIILLGRVITRLGSIEEVSTDVVEHMHVADLTHLQGLYERVNTRGADVVDTTCPECAAAFEVDVGFAHGHAHEHTERHEPDTGETHEGHERHDTVDSTTEFNSPESGVTGFETTSGNPTQQ